MITSNEAHMIVFSFVYFSFLIRTLYICTIACIVYVHSAAIAAHLAVKFNAFIERHRVKSHCGIELFSYIFSQMRKQSQKKAGWNAALFDCFFFCNVCLILLFGTRKN